jgi:hypothetical protein
MKKKYYKVRSNDDYVLKVKQLRQLLFWAKIGFEKSGMRGGAYQDEIGETIKTLSQDIQFYINLCQKQKR